MTIRFRIRPLVMAFLGIATLALIVTEADARAGRGGSFGSRGTRTHSAPPPTATAPGQAGPMERTMTQPGQPGTAVGRPGMPATPAAQPGGMFSGARGIIGGLAAGFLGAGLLGMLFGGGFMSGLAGFASFLGLLAQIGLVVLVAFLAWRWWQRRSQPAPAHAMASGPSLRDIQPDTPRRSSLGALGGALGGGGLGGGSHAAAGPAGAPAGAEIEIQPDDFDAFERLLGEVQAAYSAEDLNALRGKVTPEMLSYFAEDLAANASRGVVNQVSDVKLLQGDLAEAWREGGAEYATVAMRFSLVDKTVESASGRVVEGSDAPQEATELWTFMRSPNGSWLLAAIQQS
jgi:predicted lipid-binding transport protein (Tim44 family)